MDFKALPTSLGPQEDYSDVDSIQLDESETLDQNEYNNPLDIAQMTEQILREKDTPANQVERDNQNEISFSK